MGNEKHIFMALIFIYSRYRAIDDTQPFFIKPTKSMLFFFLSEIEKYILDFWFVRILEFNKIIIRTNSMDYMIEKSFSVGCITYHLTNESEKKKNLLNRPGCMHQILQNILLICSILIITQEASMYWVCWFAACSVQRVQFVTFSFSINSTGKRKIYVVLLELIAFELIGHLTDLNDMKMFSSRHQTHRFVNTANCRPKMRHANAWAFR